MSAGTAGAILQIGGGIMQSIGAFYAAKDARLQLRSQALALDFQARMSGLAARAAEDDAQRVLVDRDRVAAQLSARYGQAMASSRASAAARGVVVDQGSAALTQRSMEMARDIDLLRTNVSAVREQNRLRMEATNQRNQAGAALAGAFGSRMRARGISPALAAIGPLFQTAGNMLSSGQFNFPAAQQQPNKPTQPGTQQRR